MGAVDGEQQCLESTLWPAQRAVGCLVELRVSEQSTISAGAGGEHANDGKGVTGATCITRCISLAPILQDLRWFKVGNHVRSCLNCAVQDLELEKMITAVTMYLLEGRWLSSANSQQSE